MKNIYNKNILYILFIAIITIMSGCEEESKVWELTPNYSHSETGLIVISDDEAFIDTLHTSKYFHHGIEINVAADMIKSGWVFDHWEGDITGTDNPSKLTMDSDKSVTAIFKLLEYPLSVTINGKGSVSEDKVLEKITDYGHGTNILLTANAEKGWIFDHWEGDLTGTDNPSIITIDSEKTVTAVFRILEYPLSVTITGKGSVSENIVLGKTSDYDHGTNILLTANAEKGWIFDHWAGDLTGTENPSILIMDGSKTIEAVFTQINYLINLTIVGNGNVSKSPDQKIYLYGDTVQLTAYPDSGWIFKEWMGDTTSFINTIQLIVQDTVNLKAKFVQTHSLLVNTTGEGSITLNPNNAPYIHNSIVKLTATAEKDWIFDHWAGDLSGTVNPIELKMDENKSVVAVFSQISNQINLTIAGSGNVTKTPDKDSYFNGDTVQLTAYANPGWIFNDWKGDLTGTENPSILIIDSNKSVTATFIGDSYKINLETSGNGYIKKIPKQDSYSYNDKVELTAISDEDWIFDHWEGDLTGTNNPSSLTINNNKSVTAVFKEVIDNYKTENVIIVVMDGARYSETWGDPNHTYIPYMANYMSDKGVINTNFYNMEETITTSGHIYMTTGVYQVKEGKSKDYPYYPSIFQYWREETNNTSNKAWVIASKDKLEALGNCDIGDWANKYLPKTDCGINGAGTGYRDDSVTYTKTLSVLSNYKPNLVLVNLKEPDPSGHSGIWNDYLQGIKDSDKYIYKIWNFINTDSHYKGKTTMFVTNDHGRHLDGVYTGFKDHGCGCEGCRHVNFYAFGPDFKEGIETNKNRELIDIPATIAELFDLNMPYGEGQVMHELFK